MTAPDAPYVARVAFTVAAEGRRRRVRTGDAPPPLGPPRITYYLALALALERAVEDGTYDDFADAARALCWTRQRVSQVLLLGRLTPDLQEAILALDSTPDARTLHERALRPIVATPLWAEQRARWRRLSRGPRRRAP